MHHVSIGSIHYEKSVAFYKETLEILYGVLRCYQGVYPPIIEDNIIKFKGARFTNIVFEDGLCFSIVDVRYGISDEYVHVHSVKGQHIAFKANCLEAIVRWHKRACELGAKNNGLPGSRPYGHAYIGGFVIDLDGYRIEACKMDYLARYTQLTKTN